MHPLSSGGFTKNFRKEFGMSAVARVVPARWSSVILHRSVTTERSFAPLACRIWLLQHWRRVDCRPCPRE